MYQPHRGALEWHTTALADFSFDILACIGESSSCTPKQSQGEEGVEGATLLRDRTYAAFSGLALRLLIQQATMLPWPLKQPSSHPILFNHSYFSSSSSFPHSCVQLIAVVVSHSPTIY